MKSLYVFLCLAPVVIAAPAPANGFVFPDERRQRKLEPIITPPVLPVIEHLERDPSTLLPGEGGKRTFPSQVKPKFGFGGGFNVAPSGTGGLSASISSSASGGGASHSASQSFAFDFNEGFSASHSASQASSFNGFGSGFSGSQSSSQAAAFGGSGHSGSGSASQAAAFGGNGASGSQSASSAFGFNSLSAYPPDATFGDGLLDVRHRGFPEFPAFPTFPTFTGRKGVGAAAFRSGKSPSQRAKDDFFAVLVSD